MQYNKDVIFFFSSNKITLQCNCKFDTLKLRINNQYKNLLNSFDLKFYDSS